MDMVKILSKLPPLTIEPYNKESVIEMCWWEQSQQASLYEGVMICQKSYISFYISTTIRYYYIYATHHQLIVT